MFTSAVKLDFLTWKSMLIDSLQETASSGHYRNCTLWHFYTGLTFKSLWRPVAQFPEPDVKILSQNYAASFFYIHHSVLMSCGSAALHQQPVGFFSPQSNHDPDCQAHLFWSLHLLPSLPVYLVHNCLLPV